MALVFDLITFINLIFCAGIVVVSCWWTRRTESSTPLIIGAAFLLFAFSHLSLLLGLKDIFEPFLVILRIIAYILVFVGFVFIAREVMNRRIAEDEACKKHEDLNRAYEKLAADEEELKENYEELRKAGEALRESEKRFRALYDENPSMYFTLDTSGNILSVNQYGAAQLGYTAGELTGRPVLDLFYPDDRVSAETNLKKCLETEGEPVYWEFRKVRKDGSVIWVGETVRTMQRADGKTVVLVVCKDITDHKMAKAALERATEKLNLLNTVTFTEIQNAVFSLHGFLELQKQIASDEKMKDYIDKDISIVKSVNESLEFAKKYQNLGLKPSQWQNADQVFLFAISHIDFSESNLSHRTDVGGLEIYADPFLEDVFFALADNVILHGKDATEILLYYEETPESLRLIFEDDGVGIKVEEKERIFDKKLKENPGLGLFLSREILSITGISIRETGEPGKGARFEITVPKGAYRFGEAELPGDEELKTISAKEVIVVR